MLPLNLKPTTTDAMLLEWALAEMHEWQQHADEKLRTAIDSERPLGEAARQDVITAFSKERRGSEVTFFRDQGAEWHSADFPCSELQHVVLHKHWGQNHPEKEGWQKLWPRTVNEFADGNHFKPRTEALPPWRPIYVATTLDGPWHIVEGSHRSDAIWKLHRSGHPDFQGAFPAILGVHPMMHRWGSFMP